MNETTVGPNSVLEEAFAAYVQAQENGQQDAARQLLREHPGLAEEVATYYALCARVPKPWDASVNSYDGRTIGDFDLLHELGRGAEGVVYKARQKSLQRMVALKVMRHERFSQKSDLERFRRDSVLLASLRHPNIVEIYYAGESETGPYFAMELMADGSLKQKLADGWLPTPKQAAELVRVLAEAMQCAHDQQIVHRDLKPANILLTPDGMPKIVDFGLAKKLDAGDSMTQLGAIVGTPSYMAPEQANGGQANFASDIYALGAILYELVTGRPPFLAATLDEMLKQVRNDEPLPVRLLSLAAPADLEAICLKCLEKDPCKRYLAARELAADLQRFTRDDPRDPVQARLPGITERAWRVMFRHQFTNVTAWGWVLVIAGISGGIFQLAQAWNIATEQPTEILVGRSVVYALVLAMTYWITLRGCRMETGDRRGSAILIAIMVGSFLLPVFHRRQDGMDLTAYRLSLYPLLALIHAVVFFIQGSIFWVGYYLCGIGYFILGIVMLFWPDSGPILFAIFYAATTVPIGLFMLKLGRSPEFRK